MAELPVVAIAGATGNLGHEIAKAFLLPEWRERFQKIIILVRKESQQTRDLHAAGTEVRIYDEENLAKSLQRVDVLINVVGPAGHAFKEKLVRCLPQTSVRLYFPSEFGVNHYIHDFAHEEWDAKKKHFNLTKQLIPTIRVCRVYAGLLLEDSIGPWFGFGTKDGIYEAVGSSTRRTSYTSKLDVGKALAAISCLPLTSIPEEVALHGDGKSFEEIAEMMEQNGAGSIRMSTIPLAAYKAEVLANPSPTPERYLRFLMGEGKIDHSDDGLGNQNRAALQSVVRWKQMADLAQETGGKPWADL